MNKEEQQLKEIGKTKADLIDIAYNEIDNSISQMITVYVLINNKKHSVDIAYEFESGIMSFFIDGNFTFEADY